MTNGSHTVATRASTQGSARSASLGTLPSITLSFAYDALYRITNMVDAAGPTKYTYAMLGNGLSTVTEDGPFETDVLTVTNRSGFKLAHLGGDFVVTNDYDGLKRLTVAGGTAGTFVYHYTNGLASSRVYGLGLPQGAYITNRYDGLGRLIGTELRNDADTLLNGHGYDYNLANQRWHQTRTDGSTFRCDETTGSGGEFTSTPLITAESLAQGAVLRNDFTGWVGFRFRVGAANILVTDLGRWVTSGNTGSHQVKLAQGNGYDLWAGTVSVDASGATNQLNPMGTPEPKWVPTSETRYIYDGMVVIQEQNEDHAMVLSNPINAFDPYGQDVVYLLDPNAVGGAGHAAIFVGSDKDGWHYFSFGPGQCWVNPFGGNKADNLDYKGFKSFEDARKAPALSRYKDYDQWTTDSGADRKAIDAVRQYQEKGYSICGQNCDDVAAKGIKAAGVNCDDKWKPVKSHEANKGGANGSGTFPRKSSTPTP